MRFLGRSETRGRFEGRSVAIVGTGPGCADNAPGLVDSRDVVVRVNNYKLVNGPERGTGKRTDIFYSFFGPPIEKAADDLARDGVTLCMSSLPNARAIESEWHRTNHRLAWVDYRPIYLRRAGWWFCDVSVPTVDEFLFGFDLLGRHLPTTGFTAVLDVLSCRPASVYLTGFDFFRSKIHNVDEPWQATDTDDPLGHRPELERAWLVENWDRYPLSADAALVRALG